MQEETPLMMRFFPENGEERTKNIDQRGERGLCCTCEDCRVCKYPKPEGGVWHCEEYR